MKKPIFSVLSFVYYEQNSVKSSETTTNGVLKSVMLIHLSSLNWRLNFLKSIIDCKLICLFCNCKKSCSPQSNSSNF